MPGDSNLKLTRKQDHDDERTNATMALFSRDQVALRCSIVNNRNLEGLPFALPSSSHVVLLQYYPRCYSSPGLFLIYSYLPYIHSIHAVLNTHPIAAQCYMYFTMAQRAMELRRYLVVKL